MYTNEEKDLLKAARMLRDNCRRHEVCEGCIFDLEDRCVICKNPELWELLSEEEEDY
jgi:hypothetical protein